MFQQPHDSTSRVRRFTIGKHSSGLSLSSLVSAKAAAAGIDPHSFRYRETSQQAELLGTRAGAHKPALCRGQWPTRYRGTRQGRSW